MRRRGANRGPLGREPELLHTRGSSEGKKEDRGWDAGWGKEGTQRNPGGPEGPLSEQRRLGWAFVPLHTRTKRSRKVRWSPSGMLESVSAGA